MTSCDMCGYEGILTDAIVEGSMLRICSKCSSYGEVIQVSSGPSPPRHTKPRRLSSAKDEVKDIVVDDYATRIKRTRESLQFKQEELAAHIKEKVSVIQKLESNQFVPSLALARKLERYLHITLIEPYVAKSPSRLNLQDKNLTIGDLLKIKKNPK